MSNFGFNTGYIEELYAKYTADPESVSESWREFFTDYTPGDTSPNPAAPAAAAPAVAAKSNGTNGAAETKKAPAKPKPAADPFGDAERKPLRGASARIVDNMEASLGVPTATSFRAIPVKLLAENRRLINDYQRYVGGKKVSFTHILAWAIVKAVQDVPGMNSIYEVNEEGKPVHVRPEKINIGLAIAVEKKNGDSSLMVPNIKDAGNLTFGQFLGKYNDVVVRARTGKLEIADFQGTTCTLTNPGMIGTVSSVPRLMSGQAVIVAAGAIAFPPEYSSMPSDKLGRLGISQVMNLTSTYDHRVIQGAESGQFLKRISELIQGADNFYHEIFGDLNIPSPPLALGIDSSPMLGAGTESSESETIRKQAAVIQLIRAYRVRGHLNADINPLGYDVEYHPELDPSVYGLTLWDLDRVWSTGGLAGSEQATLRDILNALWRTYSRKIGVEFMHISDPEEKQWLQQRIEPMRMSEDVPKEVRQRILEKLNEAEALEQFIHTKYIGHKRFSLEGGETLIPILDMVLSDAADQGVDEVVIGMAHRGRLNVLANTLRKPYSAIFSEFEGHIDPQSAQGSGDVKYHLGSKSSHEAPSGSTVNVTLASNPSHLEAVNPVVEGMVRAKQALLWDTEDYDLSNFDKVLPVLIHGDAAFAGQGVVAETLNLSQLPGYETGGTVHIVVNNQIGFTTSPEDARSSIYATDVARMIQAPIFHVNGDDPEACVRVARIAFDYRQVFNKDIVIDMVCYRVHGHNEGDEPTYTQPLLYKKIQAHRSVRKLYTEMLLNRGSITPEEAEKILDDFREKLNVAFEETKELENGKRSGAPVEEPPKTDKVPRVSADEYQFILESITQIPEGFTAHPKLVRQLDKRRTAYLEKGKADWALGEALAFGSLLLEGKPVRLSGEDSRRGTFSHRHSVLIDQETEKEYVPLNNMREGQGVLRAYDSLLSEYAVLGFEFGYSVSDPATLTIWEAQFGDFANGGQIVMDQFISASEEKWGQVSGLVMLLPHGYEGQGPEHSSARLERYLQMCAENNMRVANPTTPANFCHLLRRQAHLSERKPLIVMTPKSLLRHPMAVSSPQEFAAGSFLPMIPEGLTDSAERLLFCSGKVYYDLVQQRADQGLESKVAIARLEQFYPFPLPEVVAEINKYSSAEVIWVQEEPRNMGGWTFVQSYFDATLAEVRNDPAARIRYVGRKPSASTAEGNAAAHAASQKALVAEAIAG